MFKYKKHTNLSHQASESPLLSREGMATTYTSPRHQRALKRITVNMGRHQEMLERLNEQADRIKGVRERSPYADDTPPDATRPRPAVSNWTPYEEEDEKSNVAVLKSAKQLQEDDEDAVAQRELERAAAAADAASRRPKRPESKNAARDDDFATEVERALREAAAAERAAEEEDKKRAAKKETTPPTAVEKKKKVWIPSSGSSKHEKWYQTPQPAVEYTSENLDSKAANPADSADSKPGRPASAIFRNGWSSTPQMNNDDAHVRPPSSFTTVGYYKWNQYLPRPGEKPTKIVIGRSPVKEPVSDDDDDDDINVVEHAEDVEDDDDEEDEEAEGFEEHKDEPLPTVMPTPEKDDDDDSSTDEDEPRPWQETARRRSQFRRESFEGGQVKASIKYQAKDVLVDEDLSTSPHAPAGARAAMQKATRLAVSEACRSVATEDLDAEVASFDTTTGLYRIECKIKIADGRVVAMAVLRDFLDFVKIKDDILRYLDDIPGGRALATTELKKLPRKRFKSVLKAKARNILKGKKRGELKWQAKQLPKLHEWLVSAVDLIATIKNGPMPIQPTTSKFSFVSDFNRIDLEDHIKCFILQHAFFTGVLTMQLPAAA